MRERERWRMANYRLRRGGIAIGLIVPLMLASCGDGDGGGETDADQAKSVAIEFATATNDLDAARMCATFSSDLARAVVRRSVADAEDCTTAVHKVIADWAYFVPQGPEVANVEVNGTAGRVEITGIGATKRATVEVVEEDGVWKVDSFPRKA